MNQKVFAVIIGLTVSYFSYEWAVNPEPRLQRQKEEKIVIKSRRSFLHLLELTEKTRIIDPLNPDRKVGKTYLSPSDSGWQISGYFRRNEDERWRPWLMSLDNELNVIELRLQGDKNLFSDDIINSERIIILPIH